MGKSGHDEAWPSRRMKGKERPRRSVALQKMEGRDDKEEKFRR
jgi:hypothetical protein